jgi:FAD:protein FMN transferase
MMRKTQTNRPDADQKPGRFAGLRYFIGLLCANAALFLAFCCGINPVQALEAEDATGFENNTPPAVVEIQPGWWESKKSLYHDIPASILFHFEPENVGRAHEIAQKAWLEFDRIGRIFNPFDPASELSLWNASDKSKKIRVSNDFFSLIAVSHHLWQAGNGCFDPTTWPIKTMWQSAEKTQVLPSEREILTQLQNTGFEKVHFSDKAGKKIWADDPRIMLDFGAVAKGYAVDRVRELLIDSGASAGLVQLGGEVSAFGDNPEGKWQIGIQHPKVLSETWGVLAFNDRIGLSTSGNYRQPLVIGGETFYHIFSPKTGKPVSEKILGVTTASFNGKASNAVLDGAATAITVAGRAEGMALAEKLGIEVLILYEKKDGSISEQMTPGFAAHYTQRTR